MSDVNAKPREPFVGPHAFQEGETLYGRNAEALELIDLVISNRIVLLHSPSGAGKTSLLQARLIPDLRKRGFVVLPVARVGLLPAADVAQSLASNRYIASTLLSLGGETRTTPHLLQRLRNLFGSSLPTISLSDAVQRYANELISKLPTTEENPSQLLVFDQFEEVLTLDPTDTEQKAEFFAALGKMLEDKNRWAVFAMREEYMAALAPYAVRIPTQLATNYRLDLLGAEPARQAIKGPFQDFKISIEPATLNKLVDDLRMVRVQQPNGDFVTAPGPSVEPVHLQVVCRNLWKRLPAGTSVITSTTLSTVGSVDEALGDYYDFEVARIAAEEKVEERAIREWISQNLITPHGIRSQVIFEKDSTLNLSNRIITELSDAYILRAENRRGVVWYELAHDRLVRPVQERNARWKSRNATPLELQAQLWSESGRPDDMLWTGAKLRQARKRAREHSPEIDAISNEYLRAAKRRNRRLMWSGAFNAAMLLVALALIGIKFRDQSRDVRKLTVGYDTIKTGYDTLTRHVDSLTRNADSLTTNYTQLSALVSVKAALESEDPRIQQRVALHVASTRAARDSNTTVIYYLADGASRAAVEKLEERGFRVAVMRSALLTTNAISYGRNVRVEDIRTIGATLIDNGVAVKRIRPFTNDAGREKNVEILSVKAVANEPAISERELFALPDSFFALRRAASR